MSKIYFLRIKTEGSNRRLVPLGGQTFEDGSLVRGDWHVAADKAIRYEYPETTVFACRELQEIGGSHYSVPNNGLYPVNLPATAPIKENHRPDAIMAGAWEEYKSRIGDPTATTGGLFGATEEGATEEPKAAPKKVYKPKNLLERIRTEFKAPSIAANGFYVEQGTWEVFARNILKKVNTLLVGPSGTGKTELVIEAARQMDYELCIYDMGSMHDPMTQMLGTHRIDADHKSTFDYAKFVTDISDAPAEGKAGKIILLDELSRAPLNTLNILLPCLDSRRFLPVEMAGAGDKRRVDVHPDVVFIATANVGSEYTGTMSMDKALVSRLTCIELEYMPNAEEIAVLQKRTGIDRDDAANIVRVSDRIRSLYRKGEISNDVSTREALRAADMVSDGWTPLEAMSRVFLPIFEGDETDGERSVVRKIFMAY